MKKRFFTIVLCLVLCLAVLPMAAFADETEEEEECFHESTYYEATEEGHVAHCADCGAVFSMESHNFMGVSDSDRHWVRCVDCEYCTHFGEHGNCTEQDVDYCLYCNALREECTTWLTEHKDADGNGFCDLCGTAVVPETPHEDGWAQNDSGKWEYYENGVAVTGWKTIGGKTYYLGTDGVMCTKWQQVGGVWYYLGSDGAMRTGWQQVGKTWYYLDSDGAMCSYWQAVGGKNYYLGSDGAMQTGWQQIGGKWYYLGSDGAMRTGWQQVGKKWYYLGSDGIMQTKWQQIGGKWYYLGSDGAMCTKWQQVGKKWYYLGSDGAMQTGWQEIGGVWYYLGSDGAMQTGWQKIGKKWYYLGSDGAMRTDWQKVGGEWYYLGADGAMRTGWQKIGKKWYYFGSDGVMWADCMLYEDTDGDGYEDPAYYFDPNGAMVTGWYWVTESYTVPDTGEVWSWSNWYYFDADGKAYNGWLKENGRTYYCDDGIMVAGLIPGFDPDNDGIHNTYCFGDDGAMVTGWYELRWSWTDPETGESDSGSDWYYFDADGKGHNGWLEDNGHTYYCTSGRMRTGWVYTDDGYHKFSENGRLNDPSMNSSQKRTAGKIEFLDHYMWTYSDRYEFEFEFMDSNGNPLSNVPAYCTIDIYNDNGECVYYGGYVELDAITNNWMSFYTEKSDIGAGSVASGTAYITVAIPGYAIFEYEERIIYDLPLEPANIILVNSLPCEVPGCRITDFYYTVSGTSADLYFTGTRILDPAVRYYDYDSCDILWELTDEDGYVIDSGTCYSPSLAVGSSFRDTKDYVYGLNYGQTYYLAFRNAHLV